MLETPREHIVRLEAENKRLRKLINDMPTCNLQFENRLAMDQWNDWKAKYFTPKGRIRKALKGE